MTVTEVFDPSTGCPGLGLATVTFQQGTEKQVLGPNVAASLPGNRAGRVENHKRNTLVITPSRIAQPTRAKVLDSAIFSMIMTSFRPTGGKGAWTISGPGILAWLGNGDNPGVGPRGGTDHGVGSEYTGSFADYLLAVMVTLATSSNGLFLDATAPSISTAALNRAISAYDTVRVRVNKLVTALGLEYFGFPDGNVIFAARQDPAEPVFNLTPRVLFGAGIKGGRENDLTAYDASIMPTFDYSNEANQYTYTNAAGTFGSGDNIAGRIGYDFGGIDLAYIHGFLGASDEIEARAPYVDLLDREWTRIDTADITVQAGCLRRHLKPGDWVWAINRRAGLTDLANTVPWGGRSLAPTLMQCTGLGYPITKKMGKYIITNATGYRGANTVIDVSDLVRPETGPTRVTVSTAPPVTLRNHVLGRTFRPGWDRS